MTYHTAIYFIAPIKTIKYSVTFLLPLYTLCAVASEVVIAS